MVDQTQITAMQIVMQKVGGELMETRGELEYWKLKAKEHHDSRNELLQQFEAAGVDVESILESVVSVVPEGIPPEVAAKIAELEASESAPEAPGESNGAVPGAVLEEEDA